MAKKSSKTRTEKEERVIKARQELEDAMDDLVQEKGSFAEQEQTILDMASQLERELTKRGLQRIADGFGERVQIGGNTYKRFCSGGRVRISV